MELCETCAKKQKHHDIVEAMNDLEQALHPLRDVCDIIRDTAMDRPPLYLYERIAEHTQDVTARFYAAWDVIFETKTDIDP